MCPELGNALRGPSWIYRRAGPFFCLSRQAGVLALAESRDSWEGFAFEEFEGGASAGGAMGDFVGDTEFFGGGGGVAASDDGDGPCCGGGGDGGSHGFRAFGKFFEFEDAGGAVPDDGFRTGDGGGEDLAGFWSAVEAFESVGDAGCVIGMAGLGIGREGGGCDVIDREVDLNSTGFGFFHELGDDFSTFGVEEAVSNRHVFQNFFEGVGHASANDDFIGGFDEVANERDFISDLGASEDGQEWSLRVVEHGGKGIEFLLHEEAGNFREIDSDDG